MMMVQYLLDADEDVVTPESTGRRRASPTPLRRSALALAQEKRVTEQIVALVSLRATSELVGEQFLHWFLQEQRERSRP
jgi:ferritin